jgi:hypothetical protein
MEPSRVGQVTDLDAATAVLTLLGRSGQPITLSQLADDLRCSRRLVEAAVQQLRLQGVPVCTDGRGAWVARTSQEAYEMYRRLRSRYISQAVTARAVRRTAAAMERRERQQLSLWEPLNIRPGASDDRREMGLVAMTSGPESLPSSGRAGGPVGAGHPR